VNLEWIVIRGSGLVAFGLLAGATIWGLLLSTKLLGKAVRAKPLTYFHESLGLGALLATAVHMIALALDDYIDFGARELLLPGASLWRPLPVALGVMAFYALTIVSLSFYFKRWIGQQAWRSIHFLSLGGFLATLIHGLTAGTDTTHPAVSAMYVASGSLVLTLVVVRILVSERSAQSRRLIPETNRDTAGR